MIAMNRFVDKVAVVSGAAGTLGLAAAERLADEGANLVCVGSGRTPLDSTIGSVEGRGGKVVGVEADLRTAAGFERVVQTAKDAFGRIDVLFNNAGVEGPFAPITEYDEAAFDELYRTNVKATFLGMKCVAPVMIDQGGGVIVNMSSVAGLMGVPGIGPYVATKHAIIGLTKTAAAELAPFHIRVVALCPGVIESPMMRRIEEGAVPDDPVTAHAAYSELPAMKRYGTPAEVAAAVAFVASDDASYMTGTYLRLEGGIGTGSA
jgi:NAD(P)-dependent dehydrogenase (short-subunit alcohol dehydrogenase family)